MKREWKPGDVAMVTARWVRTDDHSERKAVRRGCGWHSNTDVRVADWEVSAVRPLVVIDPEDREQVDRLGFALRDLAKGDYLTQEGVQAALREFANPTPSKPEEPTGLGAVVEDAEGVQWVRHEPDAGRGNKRHAWYPAGYVQTGVRVTFADISVVRVLSEGYQP